MKNIFNLVIASYPLGNNMPHRNVMILNKENLGKQVSFSNNSFIF